MSAFSWTSRLKLPFLTRNTSGPFLYPGEEIRPTKRPDRNTHMMLDGAVKRSVETGRTRMVVVGGLFLMADSVIGLRLFQVMILKSGDDPIAAARPFDTTIKFARGDITDRNGLVIATNLPTVDLFADATQVHDADETADKLLSILPQLKHDDLVAKLSSGKKFVTIERNLTPIEQANVNAEGLPGIDFAPSERRTYLQGGMLAQVLGATDTDNNGVAGLEREFDQKLKNGEPLQLTLDLRVQNALRQHLADGIARFQAKAGAGIVMNAKTAEIIAMVSLPDYDPRDIGQADPNARFNRATLGVYEMGSTFKLFNTAMALDSGKVHLTDSFDASRPLQMAGFTIHDDEPVDHAWTVPEILVHSSNIGSARMALEVGAGHQREFLKTLGLLKRPELELPEMGAPMVPVQWGDLAAMTISFGHGIAVSPVALAQGVAAVVNGGLLRQATLVVGTQREATQVISPKTSDTMRQLMRLVVTDGTAKNANVPGYLIGGKTGTANMVEGHGYAQHRVRTTFTAAFPLDDPTYVLVIVMDEPQPSKATFGFITSGWNAAPTAATIIANIAPLLGVTPRSPQAEAAFTAHVPGWFGNGKKGPDPQAGGSNRLLSISHQPAPKAPTDTAGGDYEAE